MQISFLYIALILLKSVNLNQIELYKLEFTKVKIKMEMGNGKSQLGNLTINAINETNAIEYLFNYFFFIINIWFC
jgi:hypothetical protein